MPSQSRCPEPRRPRRPAGSWALPRRCDPIRRRYAARRARAHLPGQQPGAATRTNGLQATVCNPVESGLLCKRACALPTTVLGAIPRTSVIACKSRSRRS